MSILCATDFSTAAMAAADVAAAFAQKLHLPLRLLHAMPDVIAMGEMPGIATNVAAAQAQLEAEAERLRPAGIAITTDYRHGSPSREIIAAAAEQDTRLVVLASVGKGLAERWLIGSVAERVAEAAPAPTLVVRHAAPLLSWLNGHADMSLLCAADFTASSHCAVAWVKNIAALGRVNIVAAHVEPFGEELRASKEQLSRRSLELRERLAEELGDIPFKVHVREAFGQTAAEFLHTAEQHHFGLLVVGTHQRHGWQRLKAPSFSRSVLAHSATNVLCVPAAPGTPDTRIPKIRRVLVATDLTESGLAALRHAHSLLPNGGEIRLIHVCHEPSKGINPVIATEVYFDRSLATSKAREEAEKTLKELPPALLKSDNTAVTAEVLIHHDIAAAICEEASRLSADIICLGSKGHSRAAIALLGSTVQSVISRTHIPVLVFTPPLP